MTNLEMLIAAQQKGHENEPRFMIGEQLKEIAEREPKSAELLEQDLQVKEMSLEAAEKKLKEYADKNRKGNCFCITPLVAEGILREFYGLPKRDEAAEEERTEAKPAKNGFIDLSNYM